VRIAIIQFPGSNCERETMLAVKRAGMQPEEFLWNQSREKLAEFDGFVIVGGFSYEDRSRAGAIAALDPVMHVLKQQNELGKPILGICNGAQILVESGLVPGVENNKLSMSLSENKRVQNSTVLGTGYYNAWVNIRLSDNYQRNAFTKYLTTKNILRLPVAHGEGRFIISPALLTEMQAHGMNLFQYCDEQGNIIDHFPVNPNGSIDNIAAVSNKNGNVMAMMPHPERTTHCDAIFQSMRDYIADQSPFVLRSVRSTRLEGLTTPSATQFLHYFPRKTDVKKFTATGSELVIDLVITDNHALSVENSLKHANIPVKIKRYIHWEIETDTPDVFEKIKSTGVLFNDRKEKISNLERRVPSPLVGEGQGEGCAEGKIFLIRPKEDILGQQKLQLLKNHFGVDGVHAIRHGILWQVIGNETSINDVLQTHLLQNPYAHDCYHY
jgi:phosphoribosylformylglycinamidine synthase I